MKTLLLIALLCTAAGTARAQANEGSIEGYWQDTERRILFSKQAPAGYEYGRWISVDLDQTYPKSKHISRSEKGFAVTDLLYGADYQVELVRADERSVEFTRTEKWSGCSMLHACRVNNAELFCRLENVCPYESKPLVDWRGEERYVRRAYCERRGGVEAQGIPNACR